MNARDEYAIKRQKIGQRVLEAFTIGDDWDRREAMEFAEVELDYQDFQLVELHVGQEEHKICIVCILEGKTHG